jgi:polyhydroxybutyrate depolymerase
VAPRKQLPVVLLLHGYSSNGEAEARYLDFASQVDSRGFLLVKPNGALNAQGARSWNSGHRLRLGAPDDVAYLTAVLDDVVSAFAADSARVYVVGHSNGAFMAHRLACERSQRIAAIVSLAGGVDSGACHPVQPVSVLTVHGTNDKLIQYDGGTLAGLWPYSSSEATLAFWAKADGCAAARSVGRPMHLVCDAATTDTTVFSYEGCPAGVAVEHWRLDGAGHVPNFALPAWPDAVLDFLWAHPKPGSVR